MKQAVWDGVGSDSAAPGSRVNATSFIRISGLVLVVGSVLSVVFRLVSAFFYGDTTTYANQPVNVLADFALASATILLLFGMPGVYASRARGFGVIGLIGIGLLFTASIMFGVFGNFEGAMVEPWLAAQAPSLANSFGPPAFFAFYNVQELLLVVGSILFAIPLLRRRALPRWPGFALLASAILGVGTFFFVAFPDSLATSVIGKIPSILLLVALAGIGYQAWAKPAPDTN